MSILLTLFKNDIKIFIRDWKALLLLLITPFLFIGFFVLALSPYLSKTNFIDAFNIAVVDNENSAQTRIIVRQLKEIKVFKEIYNVDGSKADELISQNKIAGIIVIPAKFSEGLFGGERKEVTVIGNKTMPLQAFVVKSLVQSAANLFSSAQGSMMAIRKFNQKYSLKQNENSNAGMDIAMKAIGRNDIFSESTDLPTYNLTPMEYFSSALIVIFLMFCGMPAMKMLVVERNSGITRRLLTTQVKIWHIITSKIMISVFLSSIQFLIIILLTKFFFKNYWGSPTDILLLFLGIIFAVSTWSILVSTISRTSASVDVIGNLGILLLAVIGGSIYPLSSMPDVVRNLSYFTINRWAMEGFMIIFSGDASLDTIKCVVFLVIIGLVQLILSIGMFRFVRN